ncbi:MAG: hypothetical protein ACYDER_05825 [Ktedonobacteraceae bacterium]
MSNIVRGVYSGFLASLIVAILYFVDYGPGNGFYGVANWFSVGTKDTGKFYGFLIILILGVLFGLLFGVVWSGNKHISISRALATGLGFGVAWWVIFAFLIANFVGRTPISHLTIGLFLQYFVPCLIYGLLLGTIYFQSIIWSTRAAR